MNKILVFLIFVFGGLLARAQSNPNYNEALAKSLGSDDYGMKMYVFVILKTGTNTIAKKQEVDSLFAGHMTNINRLVENKKLVVAGPFGKNENGFRGLFILDVKTIEEADVLMNTDPAVKAKLLTPEFYLWYGSAALPQYLKDSDKIWNKKY